MRPHPSLWVALSAALALPAFPADPPADLVLKGGRIATLDPAKPMARAIAITGGRITAAGSDEEIASRIGPRTEVIDLQGRLAVPGFIEGHGHFLGLGDAKAKLDLTRARSWDEIVAQVAQAAAQREARRLDPRPRLAPGEVGPPARAAGGRRAAPPRAVPREPGQPRRADPRQRARALRQRAGAAGAGHHQGHARPGRRRDRHATRRARPTGLLRETARDLVRAALARADKERPPAERGGGAAPRGGAGHGRGLSKGITSFQDAGSIVRHDRPLPRWPTRAASGPALRDGPRRLQRRAGAAAAPTTAGSARATASSPCAPSSARSTGRWARTGPGCSSPTWTCPPAPG